MNEHLPQCRERDETISNNGIIRVKCQKYCTYRIYWTLSIGIYSNKGNIPHIVPPGLSQPPAKLCWAGHRMG